MYKERARKACRPKCPIYKMETTRNPDCRLLRSEFREEVEKVDVGSLHGARVDVVGADPSRPDGTLVLLWQSLHEGVETDLVDKGLGDSAGQDVLSRRHIVVQVRHLELVLQVVEGGGEQVRNGSSGLGSLLTVPLLGDTGVLMGGILANLLLDILDVGLVESGRLSVFEDHVFDVFFVIETHTSEDLEGR